MRSAVELPPSLYASLKYTAATLEWVDWFNHRRLLEPIGEIPPVEFERAYYRRNEPHAMVA